MLFCDFRVSMFFCIRGLFHMLQFIAGAMIMGFEKAAAVDVSRLSQMPLAIFPVVFAEAGAMMNKSASLSELCSGRQFCEENSSL